MQFRKRILQATRIIDAYRPHYPLPFSTFLKNWFRENRQFGSRDRKVVTDLCYSYFRAGRLFAKTDDATSFALSYWLVTGKKPDAEIVIPERISQILEQQGVQEKLKSLTDEGYLNPDTIFPLSDLVSEKINKERFISSHLAAPKVWIKVQPEKSDAVKNEFGLLGINCHPETPVTWSAEQETKLTDTESFKKGYFRIQDYNSQKTANFFEPAPNENWWDACCGSGGKSLGLFEKNPSVFIYASDIRESILKNFGERHLLAGNKRYKTFVADLRNPVMIDLPKFDAIILDAPCTGSGTWVRNPENLIFFDEKEIKKYSATQFAILSNAFKLLKPGKSLFYITCSVFAEENENVIRRFAERNQVKVEFEKYLEGYEYGAENLFICKLLKMGE